MKAIHLHTLQARAAALQIGMHLLNIGTITHIKSDTKSVTVKCRTGKSYEYQTLVYASNDLLFISPTN